MDGLGMLFVCGIPGYAQLRKQTLPLIQRLASLPADKLRKYERPDMYFTRGWSKFPLRFDGGSTTRGSFYYAYPFDRRFEVTL